MDLSNIKLPEQKTNFDNYYWFPNGFSNQELLKIDQITNELPDLKPGTAGGGVNPSYRDSYINWIPRNQKTKWLYDKVYTLAMKANNAIGWDFHIMGLKEQIQYGEYYEPEQSKTNRGGHYDWHLDLGTSVPHRKLSLTVQLADPEQYEGGELQFLLGREPKRVPRKKGAVVIFPSFYLHQVTPVTKGTRRSLVIWLSGPSFK